MARATLIEAADERIVPHSHEDVYGVLADVPAYPRWWPGDVGVRVRRAAPGLVGSEIELAPRGGRPFELRVVGAEPGRRIALAYGGSWLEGEGEWMLARRRSGTLVRHAMHVRSDRWLVALVGKAIDLPGMYTRQMHEVMECLAIETGRRAGAGSAPGRARR